MQSGVAGRKVLIKCECSTEEDGRRKTSFLETFE